MPMKPKTTTKTTTHSDDLTTVDTEVCVDAFASQEAIYEAFKAAAYEAIAERDFWAADRLADVDEALAGLEADREERAAQHETFTRILRGE